MTVLLVAAAAGTYLVGVRRFDAAHPRGGFPRPAVVSFLAGCGVLAAAVMDPVDGLAHRSFAWHMVQHLVLTMLAAPLLILGRPGQLARRTLPRPAARRVVSVLRGRSVHAITRPLVGWTLFVAVLWATHYTPLYQRALESGWVHALEHVLYLGAAVLFWLPVVGVEPSRHRLSDPARLLYLFLASAASALLASTLYQSARVLYPSYAGEGLTGQRAAGALMWIVGGLLFLAAALLVAARWARRDRRVDRLEPYSRAMPTTAAPNSAAAGSSSHTP